MRNHGAGRRAENLAAGLQIFASLANANKLPGHDRAHSFGVGMSQSGNGQAASGPHSSMLRDAGVPADTHRLRFWLRRARPALLVFLAWTSVGAFLAIPDMLWAPKWDLFLGKIIDAWAWAILTPALLLIDRKLASLEQSLLRRTIMFVVVSIPVGITHTYLSSVLQLYLVPSIIWNPLVNTQFVIYYFLASWQSYAAFFGILQASKYYNGLVTSQLELERVEKGLIESRLNALRLQLEPHFLFNALNTIASEVEANPELARDMIGDLGALLRQSLNCKDRSEIPLEQELALLEHYLSIQRARFGDRIEIRLDIEPDALPVMVPSMLLQPLVENAIRHGIDGRLSGGVIELSARLANGQLHIHVLDDGVGLPRNWRIDTSAGLGVRVTRERLAALYPQLRQGGMAIEPRVSGGTDVSVCVPLDRARLKAP